MKKTLWIILLLAFGAPMSAEAAALAVPSPLPELEKTASDQGATVKTEVRPGCFCCGGSIKGVVSKMRRGLKVFGGHLEDAAHSVLKNDSLVQLLFAVADEAGYSKDPIVKDAKKLWGKARSASHLVTLFLENGEFDFVTDPTKHGIDQQDDLKMLFITAMGNTRLARFLAAFSGAMMPPGWEAKSGCGLDADDMRQVYTLQMLSFFSRGGAITASSIDADGSVTLSSASLGQSMPITLNVGGLFGGVITQARRQAFLNTITTGNFDGIVSVRNAVNALPGSGEHIRMAFG